MVQMMAALNRKSNSVRNIANIHQYQVRKSTSKIQRCDNVMKT